MIIGILLVATLIAINAYETAFTADKSTGALNGKDIALNGQGNYTGAIINFDKALATDPNDKYALNGKSYALNKLGKLNEGLCSLKVYFLIVIIYKQF